MSTHDTLRKLFIHREDTYAVQKPTGAYERLDQKITNHQIDKHLNGETTIAVYQYNTDNTLKWICFDFDGTDLKEQFDYAKRLYNKLRFEEKIESVLLEFSGMKGFHVWVFVEPIDGDSAQIWAKEISQGSNAHEIFPKQTNIKYGYGNAVKLPLATHQVSKNKSRIFNDDCVIIDEGQELSYLENLEHIPRYKVPRVIIKEIIRTVVQAPTHKISDETEHLIQAGAPQGDRHKKAWMITKDLYHAGLTGVEITEKVLEFNRNCAQPKPTHIIVSHVNYLLKYPEKYLAKEQILDNVTQEEVMARATITYETVIQVYRKWIYFNSTNQIDLSLAIAISRTWSEVPLWLILISNSGSGKSEIIKPFNDTKKPSTTEIITKITPNTFLSGLTKKNQPEPDFAEALANKPTLFLTPDFAQFVKMDSETKGQIWAQLRDLYDGFIERRAAGVNKKVTDIKVNWLICSTPIIDSELLVQQELGTRELLLRYGDDSEEEEKNKTLMDRVWDNSAHLDTMRSELALVVRAFVEKKETEGKPDIIFTQETKEKIMNMAVTVATLRAATESDRITGELTNFVYKEMPTRILLQLKAMFTALKALDPSYTDAKALDSLQDIVLSSIHPIRLRVIMEIMENGPISTTAIQKKLVVGYRTLTTQLLTAKQLGLVDYVEHDGDGEGDFGNKKKKLWTVTNHEVIQYLGGCKNLKQRYIGLYTSKYER